MRAGGRQLTNLMNKNHKGKNDEQEKERQQPRVGDSLQDYKHPFPSENLYFTCLHHSERIQPIPHPDWKPHPVRVYINTLQ